MVGQNSQTTAGANTGGDILLTIGCNGHITGGNGRHADNGNTSLPGFGRKPVLFRVRAYGGDFHAGQTQEFSQDLHGKPFLAEQYYLHAAAPI